MSLEFPTEWQGDNPHCVVIVSEAVITVIDLDEPGWAKRHAGLMRSVGTWHLFAKAGQPVFSLAVEEGEQPYYTARHIGKDLLGFPREVVAYGIGKKRLDGHVDRLWVLPNGQVCAGDDVELFARAML